ncbi:MAG: hypothetical protein OXG72_05815 [Acidobacteria bacterium]|nr:hypothetical protein [Acidobacteriota bacterium]
MSGHPHGSYALYATNIAIDEGRQQPVHFRLQEPLRLTDVNGIECVVRVVEMVGNSSLLEFEFPGRGPD